MLRMLANNWKLILSFKIGILLGWLAGSEIFGVVMIAVLFGAGIAVGMYITSQIGNDIKKRTR